MPSDADPVPAFRPHDHDRCVATTLARAESLVRARGLRLTPVRRRALEVLLEGHGAMGAYEVLERLAQSGFGHQPPVAYRALDFLVANGLAHRIRRINAFAACAHPGEEHHAAFLICAGCARVAEVPAEALRALMDQAAAQAGFVIERASLEASGRCPSCRAADRPSGDTCGEAAGGLASGDTSGGRDSDQATGQASGQATGHAGRR